MTHVENYSNLINGIFGPTTTSFDTSKDVFNRVIGALNHHTEYLDFRTNFTERLQRLKNIYSIEPTYLREIIVQINEVASDKNWEGAFAELAAYDHLNQDILNHKTYINKPIQPNITLLSSRTFAAELGKSAANLDGFVEDRPLYFDIKCFKDNVAEILEGIYKQLEQHLGRTDFLISAEYALDISYDDFQTKRNDLVNELKNSIVPATTKFFKSSVVPNLNYRILWGAGIQTSERTYHPYSHAENYHKILFNYANKFVKDTPTVIVLVVFPWYNLVVSDFSNGNIMMYRALSRRVFCQHKRDPTLFNTFNSKFTGTQTIYEVSNNLSGIIFLEDNTILSKDRSKTNIKSFVYINPNAIKPLTRTLARDFLMGLHNSEYDDFEFDNY